MNDAILAEQLRKTGNLMDLLNDEAWVREADADHASEEGTVEAGLGLQPYVELLKNASPEALQRLRWTVRVLSILLPELKGWLESWQLGRSLESVYMEAQICLYGHLRHLTPEQTAWIEALLAEGEQVSPNEQKVVRAEAVSLLAQIFTSEDWQTIANFADQTMKADNCEFCRSNDEERHSTYGAKSGGSHCHSLSLGNSLWLRVV
ncbi:hypothetical protein IQ254_04255 [Nodosilinea sp. LEGE 07088]|uniref:hypothetical protein n=1 Tax=Nodosilinea sp. LEGE 07088 TaxID=2777968 RepID=UPI00188304D8|nr:hypothetical protein [Nodosilinea sp. LEGE 07088]MBE9136419.1 hypothetical protein [Nodosilinea sp. LEGE 07088]